MSPVDKGISINEGTLVLREHDTAVLSTLDVRDSAHRSVDCMAGILVERGVVRRGGEMFPRVTGLGLIRIN